MIDVPSAANTRNWPLESSFRSAGFAGPPAFQEPDTAYHRHSPPRARPGSMPSVRQGKRPMTLRYCAPQASSWASPSFVVPAASMSGQGRKPNSPGCVASQVVTWPSSASLASASSSALAFARLAAGSCEEQVSREQHGPAKDQQQQHDQQGSATLANRMGMVQRCGPPMPRSRRWLRRRGSSAAARVCRSLCCRSRSSWPRARWSVSQNWPGLRLCRCSPGVLQRHAVALIGSATELHGRVAVRAGPGTVHPDHVRAVAATNDAVQQHVAIRRGPGQQRSAPGFASGSGALGPRSSSRAWR